MRQKNNQQMNNSKVKAIAKLLSGCVESLRISEVYAAEAAQELKLQKEFEDLNSDKMYSTWLKISHNNFLRASEEAAMWKQRAEIEWLEARKMGYDGPFDRMAMRPQPHRWLGNHAADAN